MEFGPKTSGEVVGGTPKRCARPESNGAGEVPTAQPLPAVNPCVDRVAPTLAASSVSHSTTRQTVALPRLSMEEFLPKDVLEAILGFLDQNTLCTARLVSRAFCAAASANICSLTLESDSSCSVPRHRFPRLGHVTLHVSGKGEGLAHLDPNLLDLITTLTLPWPRPEDCQALITETLSHLARMPKLRELDVGFDHMYGGVDAEATAALLCQNTNLEIISISGTTCSFPVAQTSASVTSLRELRIGRVCRPGVWPGHSWDQPSAEVSWLQQFTALRQLQALDIITPSEALPLLSNLTGLTGLTWVSDDSPPLLNGVAYSIAPLARLKRLRSVSLRRLKSAGNVEIACSLGSGSLADLALGDAPPDCSRFLTRQTALTRLTLDGHLCNLRHVGALRLELLQSLKLCHFTSVGAEGVSALWTAPSLTRLVIKIVTLDVLSMGRPLLQLPAVAVSQALAGLTQLRSLDVRSECCEPAAKLLDYPLALGPLTGLTHLKIYWGKLDNHDLRALLGLTALQSLSLSHSCFTDDVVAQLAVLTDLSSIKLRKCGVTSLAPVTDVVNPLRAARGWPRMGAHIFSW